MVYKNLTIITITIFSIKMYLELRERLVDKILRFVPTKYHYEVSQPDVRVA